MDNRRAAGWVASIVLTALVVGVVTWYVADENPSESPVAATTVSKTTAKPSWLFSATAAGGAYVANPEGSSTLTLTEVDANVTGFTDRPDRDTVVFPAAKLAEAWPTLFADSEPNAVLVTRDASGAASSYVLTVSEPVVTGSTMKLTAQIVQGKDHSSQLPGMAQAPTTQPAATFGAVSLFIDNVDPSSGTFKCENANGQVISPPGTMPVIYKPIAPYVKLCTDAGGTVSPKPPS